MSNAFGFHVHMMDTITLHAAANQLSLYAQDCFVSVTVLGISVVEVEKT